MRNCIEQVFNKIMLNNGAVFEYDVTCVELWRFCLTIRCPHAGRKRMLALGWRRSWAETTRGQGNFPRNFWGGGYSILLASQKRSS
jgi:hypothetical protein